MLSNGRFRPLALAALIVLTGALIAAAAALSGHRAIGKAAVVAGLGLGGAGVGAGLVLAARAALGPGGSGPARVLVGGGGEALVRQCFESLLGARFPTTKNSPEMPWLTSARGFPLELDGYSPKFGLGFEYQGPFHYRYNPLIGIDGEPVISGLRDVWDPAEAQGREFTTYEAKLVAQNLQDYPHSRFLEYLENDALKARLMAEHGRSLLSVPYTVVAAYYREELDLRPYIASRIAELRRADLPLKWAGPPVPALAPPPVDRAAYDLRPVALEPTEANLRPEAEGLRPLKGSMGVIAFQPGTGLFLRREFADVGEPRPDLPMVTIRGLPRIYYLHDRAKAADPETGLFYDGGRAKTMRLASPKAWEPLEGGPLVTRLVRLAEK